MTTHKPKVQAAMEKVGAVMEYQLSPLFKRGSLVTVIVRFPDNDECDFFMSDGAETITELRRLLDRSEGREQLRHDTEST